MSQSSMIAAALIVAFIVFITVRGELPGYLSVFTGTAPPAVTTQSTTGKVAETVNNFVRNDPMQYPGQIAMPSPWGGTDFYGGLFGGGSSDIGSPPAINHPL